MTKTRLTGAVIIAVLLTWFGTVAAQAPPVQPPTNAPALTPCENTEADNLVLKAQLVQAQSQLAQLQLDAERQRLEATYRAKLHPAATDVFDWQTKTFKPPTAPAVAGGPPTTAAPSPQQ